MSLKNLCALSLVVAGVVASGAPIVADVVEARANGRPKFSEGEALGYFIWKDDDTWKVRWTTFGAEHRFSGRVVLEGGQITSFKRVDVDSERKVIAPGRPGRVVRGPAGRARGVVGGRAPVVASRDEDRINQETEQLIVFQSRTNDDLDGFEFKVGPATDRLRFVLEIDGKPRPDEVELGRDNFKPNESPLVVRLR